MLPWMLTCAQAAPCTAPVPIVFARGAAAAEATGGVPRGSPECWIVRARAGQRLSARVESPERNVVVQIYRPGWTIEQGAPRGSTLPGAGEGQDATAVAARLPESGAYLVVLGTTRGSGAYDLRVEIR
ncbi:MAG: hypothetical protein ABI369_01930 [Acetobacteraceae bacterium]